MESIIRVAAIQAKRRTIPYRAPLREALSQVEENLSEWVTLIDRAGSLGCRIVALPEDTLGTLEWEAGNWNADLRL